MTKEFQSIKSGTLHRTNTDVISLAQLKKFEDKKTKKKKLKLFKAARSP